MENKEKEEVKVSERTSEQACQEIEAICALLNMRTTEFKYTQQGVGQKKEMIPGGTFEYSPLPNKHVEYLVATATALVSQFIEKGELVKYKEKVEKAEEKVKAENKNDLAQGNSPEPKMEVVKEESNKAE